jgi:hypothetical protein
MDAINANKLLDKHPKLAGWRARIRTREAYKRAAAKQPEPNMSIFM